MGSRHNEGDGLKEMETHTVISQLSRLAMSFESEIYIPMSNIILPVKVCFRWIGRQTLTATESKHHFLRHGAYHLDKILWSYANPLPLL